MTIECKVYHDGEEIARLRFTKLSEDEYGFADYGVEIGVDNLGDLDEMALLSRTVIGHQRFRYNSLMLIRKALFELTMKELSLAPETRASDMERRQRHPSRAIQGWAGRLRDYRSSVRGRQPVEHGED